VEKIDYKKNLPFYKVRENKPVLIEMPLLHYLMIDGAGNPNTSTAYREAVEALFKVSYTLKFMIKNGPKSVDYVVLPLEGLGWSDDMNDFVRGNKDNWKWTAMILQPEFITHELFETAKHDAAKKKKLAALDLIRLEAFSEGLCAQTLDLFHKFYNNVLILG